jgi:hypothetical protein
MRQLRVILGILIVIFSLALLVWGLLPARHEVRTQPISPTELQLPTPETSHSDFLVASEAGDVGFLLVKYTGRQVQRYTRVYLRTYVLV